MAAKQKLQIDGRYYWLYDKSVRVDGVAKFFFFSRVVTKTDAEDLSNLIAMGIEIGKGLAFRTIIEKQNASLVAGATKILEKSVEQKETEIPKDEWLKRVKWLVKTLFKIALELWRIKNVSTI